MSNKKGLSKKDRRRLLEFAGMAYSRRSRGYEDEEHYDDDDMNGDMNGDDMNDTNGDEMNDKMGGDGMNGEEGSSVDDILASAEGLDTDQLLDLVQKLVSMAQGMGGSAEKMSGNGDDETSMAYRRMRAEEQEY